MKRIQIFRPGTFIDANGVIVTLTAADLAASARAYNPELHEAPFVIGHPKADDQAWGWAKAVSFSDDEGMVVEPHQVNVEFSEQVQAGAYKKVSASFYGPDAPNNPVPGVWYLRHVGFLGAQPPAVKGLRAVEFADDDKGVVSFGDWVTETQANLWRRFREHLIATRGQEVADDVVPNWMIDSLIEFANREPALIGAAFAEAVAPATTPAASPREQELQAQLDAAQSQLAQLHEKEAAAERATRRAEVASFAEALQGVAPKHRDALVEALLELESPRANGAVVEFGEGDARAPVGAAVRAFLQGLPPVVSFTEHAVRDQHRSVSLNDNPLLKDAARRQG